MHACAKHALRSAHLNTSSSDNAMDVSWMGSMAMLGAGGTHSGSAPMPCAMLYAAITACMHASLRIASQHMARRGTWHAAARTPARCVRTALRKVAPMARLCHRAG